MVAYKAMFEVFGIGAYLPYRLAAIIPVPGLRGPLFSIARRRIGSLSPRTDDSPFFSVPAGRSCSRE
jgi:hypothetical protein